MVASEAKRSAALSLSAGRTDPGHAAAGVNALTGGSVKATMKKLLGGIALVAPLALSVASPLRMTAQDLAAGKERIRSMIRKELGGPSRLPSMAVAVVHGDAIVWEENNPPQLATVRPPAVMSVLFKNARRVRCSFPNMSILCV